MRAWDENRSLRWTLIALLALVTLACWLEAHADPVCDPTLPQPPWVMEVNGESFPVERFDLDPEARTMVAIPWKGVFCDGFEGS